VPGAVCGRFFWSEGSPNRGHAPFCERRGSELCSRTERYSEDCGLAAGGQRSGYPVVDGGSSCGDGSWRLVERAEGGRHDGEQDNEVNFGAGLQREPCDRHFGDNSELSWLASEHDTCERRVAVGDWDYDGRSAMEIDCGHPAFMGDHASMRCSDRGDCVLASADHWKKLNGQFEIRAQPRIDTNFHECFNRKKATSRTANFLPQMAQNKRKWETEIFSREEAQCTKWKLIVLPPR
jgi:hypothetical protein